MLLKVHQDNIGQRQLDIIIDVLSNDGVIIYPTDTVYAFGCSLYSRKGMEQIARLKNQPKGSNQYSLICADLSHLSDFTSQIGNSVYKIMKKALPGPFTFILKANGQVPKIFRSKKKTIGIRVPDKAVVRKIVSELGHPLVSSSVNAEDNIMEHYTDPELIHERFKKDVQLVIDGGIGGIMGSTVLDCTGSEVEIVRQGAGEINL